MTDELTLPAGAQTVPSRMTADARMKELHAPVDGSVFLEEGARIQMNLAYNSCPGVELDPYVSGGDDLEAAVNFDIALCGDEECLIASESFDDTDEGFEVVLPHSFSEWGIYLFFWSPQYWQACEQPDGEVRKEEVVRWTVTRAAPQ